MLLNKLYIVANKENSIHLYHCYNALLKSHAIFFI